MAAITFKGRHFQHNMILQSVRWYLAYALSYRDIEELMAERGFSVDHSTINRWVLHYSPQLDAAFRRKKKRVGKRWRMDETYIKVKGQWKYYYRAIDKQGQTIDFLLTATRDTKAALHFLKKAIAQNGNARRERRGPPARRGTARCRADSRRRRDGRRAECRC